MFDLKDGYYYVVGEALDVDTLFRLRDSIVNYAYEEIKENGYVPAGPLPEVHTAENAQGHVEYAFRWKVIKTGR